MRGSRFDIPPGRPLWLVTLADLSLLLVGFFVFLQANERIDATALSTGIRAAFDTAAPPPMAVEGARVADFAGRSAALPAGYRPVVDFVRDAARDPRIAVTLTGGTNGAGDVDPVTGSAAILAMDRARSVAAVLVAQGAVRADQIAFAGPRTGLREVHIDLGYAGDRQAVAVRQPPVAAPLPGARP